MKPYYEHAGITIYHGDCRELLPTFSDKAFDIVLTDPPYNAGIGYDEHDDKMDRDAYAEWCRAWFDECRRVGRRLVIFPGHGNMPVWWTVQKPAGFGCWYKPGNPAGGGIVNFCEWEPWLYWGPFLGGSDVIRATVSKQPDTGSHPCPKPISLFRNLVARTKAEDVLDPFMGSGTTLRAAKDCGRRAVGIDISERYCEIAARRLGQETLDFGEAS